MDAQIYRVYHRYAKDLNFPLGMCGDIPVCFQHFHSFEEAREAWNRRKKRIDYHNIGYIFIEEEEFKSEMEEFDTIIVEKKIVFTINFDLKLANTKVIRVDTPPDTHFMETAGHMKKYYEKDFCAYKWVNQRV